MAGLTDLPTELILAICAMLPEPEGSPNGLGCLARVNRRLHKITEPFLYKFGVDQLNHFPLLWAAKSGNAATLGKALAAGAKVDHRFAADFSRRDLEIIHGLTEASVAWRTQSPKYWPPDDRGGLKRRAGRMSRDVTGFPSTVDRDNRPDDSGSHDSSNLVGVPGDGGYSDDEQHGPFSYVDHRPAFHHDHDPDRDFDTRINPPLTRAYHALHVAVQQGHLDLVSSLLDAGAPIDATCANLCRCTGTGGAATRYDATPQFQSTALHLAICSLRLDLAKLLISRGARARNSIHQLASENRVDLLQQMFDADPNVYVDRLDEYDFTPLYYAVTNRHWESTVPLLIGKGVSVDRRYPVCRWHSLRPQASFTLLAEVCRLGRFEDALKLIELGASVKVDAEIPVNLGASGSPNVNNQVPLLHLCCMKPVLPVPFHGRLERIIEDQKRFLPTLIARLVSLGASQKWVSVDCNEVEYAETPLSVALWHGNLEALEALRVAGVDMLSCDSMGRNALMLALGSGPLEMHYSLAQLFACRRRDKEKTYKVLKLLLRDSRLDIKHRDSNGNNVLHWFFGCYALYRGEDEEYCYHFTRDARTSRLGHVLRLLLAKGADPLARNKEGHCAVDLIVQTHCGFAMKILAEQVRTVNILSVASVPELCSMLFRAVRRGFKLATDPTELSSPPCGHLHSSTSFEPWVLDDAALASVLDMDPEHVLTTDPSLLAFCVKTTSDEGHMPLMRFAPLIWTRGRHSLEIAPAERLVLLLKILTCHFGDAGMARQMLDGLPDDHIDGLDGQSGQETLLYRAVRSLSWERDEDAREVHDALVKHLVKSRGANIHLAMAEDDGAQIPRLVCYYRRKGLIMTPLLWLIYASAEYRDRHLKGWVGWMLGMQPIRGNPQAGRMLYLHKAVNLQVVLDNPKEERRRLRGQSKASTRERHDDWENPRSILVPQEEVIRALLEAGADRTELDDDGNTPLSSMLSWLVEWSDLAEDCVKFFRPLSMGVDVNRRNKAGRSVVDYLGELMSCGSRDAATCLKSHLKLVRLENGVWKIKWLRGAW